MTTEHGSNAVCRITDLFETECHHCAARRAETERLHRIARNPLAEEQS